jgi:hypothetical protein
MTFLLPPRIWLAASIGDIDRKVVLAHILCRIFSSQRTLRFSATD